MMRQAGKRLLFVTNNSSKSLAQYVAKFKALGIDVDSTEVRLQLNCAQTCTWFTKSGTCAVA